MRSMLIAAAVALAFADSSIVVLALPELLQRFHTSVSNVAWGVTSYNLAVALVSAAAPDPDRGARPAGGARAPLGRTRRRAVPRRRPAGECLGLRAARCGGRGERAARGDARRRSARPPRRRQQRGNARRVASRARPRGARAFARCRSGLGFR